MNSFKYDPYAILQLNSNATFDEIKKAYRALALLYHPDRGGNTEMFRILQEAYESIKQSKGNNINRNLTDYYQQPEIPQRGQMKPDGYNQDTFNRNFDSNVQAEVDYVYGVDETDFSPRNMGDYRRQRDQVKMDLESMKPLFRGGMGFDPNVFNRLFEKLKKEKEEENTSLVPYEEPRAMVSQNAIGFSNVNPHAGSISRHDISTSDLKENFCALNDPHNNSFNHPDRIRKKDYQRMKQKPDVTRINSMSQKESKRRIGDYHSSKYQIPKGGAKPPQGDLNYNFDSQYNYPDSINQPRITNSDQTLQLLKPQNTSHEQGNQQYLPHPAQAHHVPTNNPLLPHDRPNDLMLQRQQQFSQHSGSVVCYTPEIGKDGQIMTPQIIYQPQQQNNIHQQQYPQQHYQTNQQQQQQNQYQQHYQTQHTYQRQQQNYKQPPQNYQPPQHNYQQPNNILQNQSPRSDSVSSRLSQSMEAEKRRYEKSQKELEEQINRLQKKVNIQDKLIRKINKSKRKNLES